MTAATAKQFFVSDSIKHFLRGALYFDTTPNADSLGIVNSFLQADMFHLINTFEMEKTDIESFLICYLSPDFQTIHLIAIDNILVSDEVISEQFVCDLNKCKGGCCEDGDSGAPLTTEELELLRSSIEEIKPFITAEGIKILETEGLYKYDQEFGWVTPTIGGKMCAYGYKDHQGIIKCGIEQANLDKKN